MRARRITPQQWWLLGRLQRAGCPLDTAQLEPPDNPVRLINKEMETNVFQFGAGAQVGIALLVRVVATVPITIAKYRVEADWLTAPLEWVEPCATHRGYHCLTTATDGHLKFKKAINNRVTYGGRLKAREFLEGFLVGSSHGHLHLTDEKLSATLWIQDIAGREYPYCIELHNRPLAVDEWQT